MLVPHVLAHGAAWVVLRCRSGALYAEPRLHTPPKLRPCLGSQRLTPEATLSTSGSLLALALALFTVAVVNPTEAI